MGISAELRRGTTVHLTTSSGSIVRATSAASRSADIGRYPLCRTAGHRRQVADVVVDRPEEGDDRSLVGGDRIKIAHFG
jgi:hypothetical protein